MTILSSLSTKGGAKLEIGDIIATERTVLADGKRLLPLDGTVLDAGQYPLLAALWAKRPKLIDTFWKEGGTFESQGISPDGQYYLATDPSSFSFYTKEIRDPASPNVLEFSPVGMDDNHYNPNGTQSAVFSDNNQYRFFLTFDTNGTRLYVNRSIDGGSSYASAILSGTTIGTKAAMWCSANGQTVRIAFMFTGNVFKVFESTDFGASFAEIISEASGAAYETIRITTNGTYALLYNRNNNATVLVNLDTPALIATITAIPIAFGYPDISEDGGTIATTGTLGNQGPSLASTVSLHSKISVDDGATWEEHPIDLSPYLGLTEGIAEARGGCQLSTFGTYMYHPVTILNGESTLAQQALVVYDYVKKVVTDIIKIPQGAQVLVNGDSPLVKSRTLASEDADRFCGFNNSGEYGFTIKFDQYLSLPFGSNKDTVMLKVVADPAP